MFARHVIIRSRTVDNSTWHINIHTRKPLCDGTRAGLAYDGHDGLAWYTVTRDDGTEDVCGGWPVPYSRHDTTRQILDRMGLDDMAIVKEA